MVLRDERDKKQIFQKHIMSKKTKRGAKKLRRRNSMKTKRRPKSNRIKTKKYINKSIIFQSKNKTILQQEEKIEKDIEVCSICCEPTDNLKYVNCKRGGVQSINFGRYGGCCKDKPICEECIEKCFNKCPFCNCHPLHSLKNKFKQKKASFAVRKERLKLKMLRKIKNKLPILRVSVRRSRRIRHVDISPSAPPVYVMDRTPWIESSLWRRRVI